MKISAKQAARIAKEQRNAQNLKDYGRKQGPTKAQFIRAATRFLEREG